MINPKKTTTFYAFEQLLKYFIVVIILLLSHNTYAQNAELSKLLEQQQYQKAVELTVAEAEKCDYCPNATQLMKQAFVSIISDPNADLQPILDHFLTPSSSSFFIFQFGAYVISEYNTKLIIPRWKQVLNKLEQIAKIENDLNLEAQVNLSYGQLCYYTYQMDSVEYFHDRTIILCEKAFEAKSSKKIPFYQNYVNFQTGHTQDFEKALAFSFKILDILKDNSANAQTKTTSQRTYLQIAHIYLQKGDVDRAIEYTQQALQIQSDPVSKIYSLQLLYKCYIQAGNLKEASSLLQEINQKINRLNKQNLLAYQEAHVHKIEVNHLTNILEDKYSTPEQTEATVNLILSTGNKVDFENNIALANYLINQNDSILSFQILTDLQNLLKNVNATNMPRLAITPLVFGDFWLKFGQPQKALEKYQEAITMLMAGAKLEEGQDIITSTYDHKTLLKILIQKDQAYEQLTLESLDQQLIRYQNLKLAIEVIDQLREDYSTKGAKILLLNNVPKVYNEAIDLLHTIYKQDPNPIWLTEAFELSEKSKAMLLMDALKEDKAHHFGNVPDSLRKQEQSLQKDISFYQAELFKAKKTTDSSKINRSQKYIFEKRTQLDELKKYLEKTYPKYYQLKHNEQIASIADIQKGFENPEQGLIQYMVSENFVHIFFINSKDISWHKFSKQQLKEPLEQFYKNLTNTALLQNNPEQAYQQLIKNAYKLYQLLLAPLEEELTSKKIKELIIVPDGNLTYIPFEALLTAEVTQTLTYKMLPYLIKTYNISYSYSATLWLECLQKAKQNSYNNQLLGFAPNYDKTSDYTQRSKSIQAIRKSLDQLTGIQEELAFLQENFKGSFYVNEEANEQTFKQNASDYGLIHFAMHGVIDVEQPNYSALIFAENQDTLNDNFLYAYELPSLTLNAQLIVLSACQTGYGKYQNGEGVMSLGRGFMYAGTPSLVMTLWAINDQASAKIMELFYLNLKKGLNKRTALQQAKLSYLEESKGIAAHPAFWSPFVLHGDSTALNFQTGLQWYYWLSILVVLVLIVIFISRKFKR